MDQIRIDHVRFFAHHGVLTSSGSRASSLYFPLCWTPIPRKAGQSDRLEDSTSYAEVAEFLVNFLTQNTYRLLEAAVEQACRAVLLRFPLIRGGSPWS